MRGLVVFVAACVMALAPCAAVAQVPADWQPLVLPSPAQPSAPADASGPEAAPAPQEGVKTRGTVLQKFGARPSAEEIGPRPADAPVRRRFPLREPGAHLDEPSRIPPVAQEDLPPEPDPEPALEPAPVPGQKPWVPLVPDLKPRKKPERKPEAAPRRAPGAKGKARPEPRLEGPDGTPWVPLVPEAKPGPEAKPAPEAAPKAKLGPKTEPEPKAKSASKAKPAPRLENPDGTPWEPLVPATGP
ncbi:hypothetical protein [Desulfocurvus vexinensis]|uniref:hypothetical protein n=1 Tax=Desulfocurvus vexinensis TaxID=399548 RepID=UPI00048AED56|nr:hypothetical protein [Desulfocurvus vexinensis]